MDKHYTVIATTLYELNNHVGLKQECSSQARRFVIFLCKKILRTKLKNTALYNKEPLSRAQWHEGNIYIF